MELNIKIPQPQAESNQTSNQPNVNSNAPNVPKNVQIENSINKQIASLYGKKMSIEDLLRFATENDCSDLQIEEGIEPYISKFGKLHRLNCEPTTNHDIVVFMETYISNEQRKIYTENKQLDASVVISIPTNSTHYNPNAENIRANQFRYRAAFSLSQRNKTISFRMIKPKQPMFGNLSFDTKCIAALREAFGRSSGLTFITGPTGSGKSTTFAACINSFTKSGDILDNKMIITLEDPIENLFTNTNSVKIMQKELGMDFNTFAQGIKIALREHPNVILIGESRDKEVICADIEAGRTGHATASTLHSSDVAGSINRLMYHLDNDINLCMDLISQLNIILSQKMIQSDDKYIIDTQYLLFDDKLRKHVTTLLEKPDVNMYKEINALILNPELQANGLAKDWSFKDLHKAH